MPKPEFKLYNSETKKIETLDKKPGEKISMYTCGPTVYNFAHIGNFRTYVFEDILRRSLKYFGYKVHQAMNLTDVDDKTIKGAIATRQSLDDFTKPFKEAFFKDLKTLNIEQVEVYPEATGHIDGMINMIQKLLDKGIAYFGSDKSVYFAIDRFPKYGRLSHLDNKTLQVGASKRIQHDEYDKESLSDFVLWKAYDPERDGLIYWESPFGKGRPGWHIECSAMAFEHLGETIDIHVGGVDNLFPHHENEIAQTEACTGHLFVKHWCHAEHLLVDGKKMSKSLGNFFTLRDLLEKGYTGKEVRFALLQSHYRMQLNFTLQTLEAAKIGLKRINTCYEALLNHRPSDQNFLEESYFSNQYHLFDEAIGNDLNIAEAIALLFNFIKDINHHLAGNKIGSEDKKEGVDLFEKFDSILGILSKKEEEKIPKEIEQAMILRQEARTKKDFKEADRLRNWIESKGFLIEDSPQGPKVKKA